ncbi:MAG TPA: hypothetical protein VKP65_03000 [Rhodothermales bacterium]|nr:hypothetical protein [Rhodothermales bacterium]
MKDHGLTSLSVILVLALNLSACNLLGSEEEVVVVVRQITDVIIVTNKTSAPIYTAAFERESLARINWHACVDPDRCEGVSPKGSLRMPLQDVYDYETGDEVVVYWWHLRKISGTNEYERVDFTAVVIDT